MNNVDWISIIAVAEFGLIILAVLGIVLGKSMRRHSRDRTAASDLVSKVRNNQTSRRNELLELLQSSFGFSGNDLSDQAQRLIQAEQQFYEEFIRTYLTRDDNAVRGMDEKLRAVIEPYLAMKPTPVIQETIDQEAPDNASELAHLQKSMRSLSEDIVLYRETLNRVFSEYTAMFGVHLDPQQQLSAKEILERLDSGQLGGEDETTRASGGADTESDVIKDINDVLAQSKGI